MARWQFYNKTHAPVAALSLINSAAYPPYPFPNEIGVINFPFEPYLLNNIIYTSKFN